MAQLSPIEGDYVVGKGMLFFQKTGEVKWEEIGDIDGFSTSSDITKLERFSNQYPVRTKTDSRITQQNQTISFTLFQMTARNRAMGLMSDVAYLAQVGVTGQVATFEGVEVGGIYRIGKYDLSIDSIVGEDTAATPYVEGTHYESDDQSGMIKVLAIPGGVTDMVVNYDAAAILAATKRLNAGIGSAPDLAGALMFRGVNDTGRQVEVMLHDVRLSPSGERQYISDDYSSIQIEGEVIADSTQPSGFELGWERDLTTG
jgi:hypothetical protein